ncbi:MAG: RIP metalloprotease RseP [bacterium]|jgi:regulator of sigma E protease
MLVAAFWVVLVFAVIVIVHEFGHFLLARVFDIEVTEFCIGIGPKLWGFKHRGTYYGICLLPIGGFVKVAGMEPGEPQSDRSFNSQPVSRRIAVIAAGPVFNFILAVLLVFALGFFGYPKNKVRVGAIFPGGPAEAAGFEVFDVIESVDSKPVESVLAFQRSVRNAGGRTLEFEVERDGKLLRLSAAPTVIPEYNNEIPSLGVALGKYPEFKSKISSIIPGSPAFKAQLQVGDVITSVNSNSARDGWEVYEFIELETRAGQPVRPAQQETGNPPVFKPVVLGVVRDNELLQITIQPESNAQVGANVAYTGMVFEPVLVKLPFAEAMETTFNYLRDIVEGMIQGIWTLFHAPTQNLVGPLGITNLIAQSAKSGPYQLMLIAILLNVNLGLINLFPIPALDGGRLVFLLLEGLFRVRINEHKEALVHLVGFIMLIGLIIVITFKEVLGLLPVG